MHLSGREWSCNYYSKWADTVSLSYDEYKSMKSRIELLELLAEADEDVAYGRVSPIQDTFNDLRAMLKGK